MATEEGQLMTKVMPNKTVGVNLQSSLNVESSSFSTIQDFARNCNTETSSNDGSSTSGIDADTITFTPIQKTCLKEKTAKLNKEIELTERIKKRSISDGHLPGLLLEGETESRNDGTDDNSTLLKKQTCNVVLPDHIDFFARSAFPLISNAKGTEPSLGLTELSSTTCSSLIANTNLVKSKAEIHHKKQNLKLNVPLTSAKCLPNSNISLLHPKDDREINLSMPSSVYGTKLSNIECVLTGLSLDKKKMDDEEICESEPHIEQQMVHLAGGSVNLISCIQDDTHSRDSICRGEEEKCNEKSIKHLEGKVDVISKVTDDDNYFSSQKQVLETLQENHKNSIISYPSVLNTTAVHDNLKLYNVQKTTKTQSLEQHISKLIAQNAAIVDTLNPIRPRHYVRHLSFSEPLNEREHRKSTITSKLRRFSEDLSSTVNNTPYLVNKSKLHIALMGQSDSGFIVNCKNLDSVPEHKDISASYPYNLNGMCYTISESEKSPFSSPVSSKSIVPEEKDFVKPATSKPHYNLVSNEKLLQLDDKFSGEFTGKLNKQHRKSESSIIKDLLLKPKHARMPHSAISSIEGKLTPQLNMEALGKLKVNEVHSSMHICKFCNISFLSKDNLEAHQLHYCKLRNQSGTTSKSTTSAGFSLKEQPLLDKLNDSSLLLSYETSSISDDRLNTAGIAGIRSFGNDVESWIPPLKQRKLSEPVLSKSHIENNVSRRRTTEFLRNDKGAHCIHSASGGWNSQMCGGKVQIFDEIGNKQTMLKSSTHNQTSLFTLLGVDSHHSFAFSENTSWVTEGGKMKKSNKISTLPTVVVTISKPELNSGGTVMQVHSSMAAGGSSLCVQALSQAPLMSTGSSEITKWKNFQSDISFGTKLDLSPISKNISNENERFANLVEQSPAHCDTPKSLVIESPGTSPLSEMTECGSPSSTQSSTLSFGKQERSPVRKIGRSENRDFEFSSPLGKSLCVMSLGTTMENATRKNSSDSSSIPLFCIPDGPSAVFNCISVFNDSTTMPSTVDNVSLSDDKAQTTSSCKTSTESSSDNTKNKCPNPSRPTFLPLKKGITLVGSTLISPETPRPKKSSIQLYLGGHAYTSLGLKCSTRSTFCCIYRPQPMYVPQDTDPKLSMYSNWQVVPSKEELLGMTPSQLLGLYNSRQKKENCKATLTVAKMGNTLVCTHSSYWTFRMQDATKEDLQKHSKIMEKASDQDITIEDKSQLESLTMPVEISYVSTIENGSFVSKDQVKVDENSSLSLKENSHSEDTAEESCTSHSNAHSPDDTMLSNPPKRARHSEGSCGTTDEGTYVRGRGWGKYICEECGIRCKKPSVLKKHIRTHTNLRPYKCYHCAFAFKTKGNLTKHMKSKAHFKKCIELGVVPVPTTVDDSQIDEEALDKQEKLDKDICPSLNAQEFQDGEEIDDDADESDHSDNEEDDDCNSDTLNLGERIREMKNLKEIEQTHSASEKEFAATRDMTEKEGEAAQSLLHLSICNLSQSSQKKSSAKSLSSGLLSIDHSEDSQSSSVLGSEITIIQNSSCITDFEDALSSPITSKGMATSPVISSNPHRGSAKISSGTGFAITDSTYSPGQTFSENRSMERKSGSFENISPLSFRVTSPNSDYRERPQTMWTTTSPQSWHGHSSLSLFPNSHVKYQGKGVIWDGQLLDTGVPKPVQFVIDTEQPMDLRVSKTKDRIPEETSRLTLYEDWRISQNVAPDHVVRTENPKSNSSIQQDEEVHCCKTDVQGTQEQQIPCLATENLSPKPVEENNMRPIENITVTKCQDSKNYAKPTGCHENSIPSYNVGRSEPTFDAGVSAQAVQYDLPTKSVDDCIDSESQPPCPISPISPPIGEDTVNHLPVIFHENAIVSSHNVSKSDHGTPHRQRECLEKNGALRNSYVSEGKCTCAICNKTFTKPSQLRLHVNIHYFERPFRCDDCAISFRTNGHLEKHKRSASHYNKLHTNTSFGTPCADNPRPFKCSDCNIAFRMHGHLAKHLRSKMHIMKLECLGKLPFGMYAEMERTGVNFNDIDTTDCDNSLESLQEIAQHLYTPPNAQQSVDLTTQTVQTTKPKPHLLNSSYSSATPLQIINTSSSCYNSEIQQINPALNLSSLNNCSSDRSRKLSPEKSLLAVSERAGAECRTALKEYITEFSHLDASAQSPLHSRTCSCDSCVSSKITPFSSLGDSCTSRPVKKEQWKLKDRLIAEFQEESTHLENPR